MPATGKLWLLQEARLGSFLAVPPNFCRLDLRSLPYGLTAGPLLALLLLLCLVLSFVLCHALRRDILLILQGYDVAYRIHQVMYSYTATHRNTPGTPQHTAHATHSNTQPLPRNIIHPCMKAGSEPCIPEHHGCCHRVCVALLCSLAGLRAQPLITVLLFGLLSIRLSETRQNHLKTHQRPHADCSCVRGNCVTLSAPPSPSTQKPTDIVTDAQGTHTHTHTHTHTATSRSTGCKRLSRPARLHWLIQSRTNMNLRLLLFLPLNDDGLAVHARSVFAAPLLGERSLKQPFILTQHSAPLLALLPDKKKPE